MMQPEPIDSSALAGVTGGGWLGKAGRLVGRFIPGLNVGLTAWGAYSDYADQRAHGKSVGASLGHAAGEALRDITYYDLWGPTPAY